MNVSTAIEPDRVTAITSMAALLYGAWHDVPWIKGLNEIQRNGDDAGPFLRMAVMAIDHLEYLGKQPLPESKPIKFYDITTDEYRPITQADVDILEAGIQAQGRLISHLRKCLEPQGISWDMPHSDRLAHINARWHFKD